MESTFKIYSPFTSYTSPSIVHQYSQQKHKLPDSKGKINLKLPFKQLRWGTK